MRRPKHTTAKARTKAAADRTWIRRWFKGADAQAMFRSVMDRVMENVLGETYGVKVAITGGKLASVTYANGETRSYA